MAAAHLRNESMSKVDAAWLHMDSRTNMMVITGVMMFDHPIDMKRFKATWEYRCADLYPRFRMRVREGGTPLSGPRWEEDPHFDISSHVHRLALPPPGDQAMLQEIVGDLMSTPLDFNKPPWQTYLVENYGPGCAVVTRLAHCIADGIALMHVVLSLSDCEPDAPWPEPPVEDEYRPPIWTRILVPAMSAVDSTLRLGENVIHEGMETLVHPTRLLEVAKAGTDVAKFSAGYTLALGKLLLLGPDEKTLFKGKLSVTKRAAWTQPMPLSEVKAVGKLLCGTVNDVLLSCVAGGIRRYIAGRGDPTEGLNIRAMVPVNLRPEDEFGSLGNRFGLIYLSLPVGIVDTQERLQVLKRRMDAIKNTPEALVAFDILNTVGFTPIQVEKIITSIFAMKATAVMTNVPGPRQTLYFAGAPIRGFTFWVPTSADLSLGVSIFSYDGEVIIGVATDAGLVPDPENLVAGIEAEFVDMQEYVRYVREDDIRAEDVGLPMEARSTIDLMRMPEAPCAGVEPQLATTLHHPAGRNGRELQAAAHHPAPTEAGPAMCQALTKAGLPCQNRALPGQTTCRVHTVTPP